MKNNKFLLILIILCLIFVTNKVNALEEFNINMSLSKPTQLVYNGGAKFKNAGYEGTIDGQSSISLCLDPGLTSALSNVGSNYSYARKVDNSNNDGIATSGHYDQGLYNMYKFFYNNIKNNSSSENIKEQRAYLEGALRIWTFENHFDYLDYTGSPYYSDANTFKAKCTSIKGSSFNTNECFGSGNGVANYYNQINSPSINWENPLKITPKDNGVKIEEGGNVYYKYSFDVVFASATNTFFDDTYSKGINNVPYANISQAFFSINDNKFDVNGDKLAYACYDYSGGDCSPSNSTKNYYVLLTEEQYNNYKTISGDIVVTMNYSFYHPLSIENLLIARVNKSDMIHQRMFVVSNKPYTSTITVNDGGTTPIIDTELCKQENNKFYYNSSDILINDYKTKCGCAKIDYVSLNESNKRFYDNNCSSVGTSTISGKINDCSSKTSKSITVSELQYITVNPAGFSGNRFCDYKCTENIKTSLPGYFKTNAGYHFDFNDMGANPLIESSKSCTMTIKVDNWKIEMQNELQNYQTILNNYSEMLGKKNASVSTITTKYTSYNVYSYSYNQYTLNINGNYSSNSVNRNNIRNLIVPNDSQIERAKLQLSNEIGIIENLVNELNNCSSLIENYYRSHDFYIDSTELKYLYNQKDKKGEFLNNSLPIDDSILKKTVTNTNSNIFNYDDKSASSFYIPNNSLSSVQYNYFNTKSISNSYSSKTSFKPSIEKYVNTFNGEIFTNSQKNTIYLGNYFDIKAGTYPGNYDNQFIFEKLGDNNIIGENLKNKSNNIQQCKYDVDSEIVSTCVGSSCDSSTSDIKNKLVYRVVDPSDIDPNKRIVSGKGMANWRSDKAKAVINDLADDTYNPKNIEYSFNLDSAKIKEIREGYNSDSNYSDFMLSCNNKSDIKTANGVEGAECVSEFVSNYADNLNGRNMWKYYDKSKDSILMKKQAELTQSEFDVLSQKLGSGLQP